MASEARITAVRLTDIPAQWRTDLGGVRAGSAVAKLLTVLPAHPILSAEDAVALLDAPRSSVFAAITRLHDAGVVRPLTERHRDQVWGAGLILAELDDLAVRAGAAAIAARETGTATTRS